MQRTTTSSAPPQRAARLRPANPLDAEAIADIHNQYVDSGPYTMESRHWQAIDVKHDLEHFDDRAGFLVAEDTDGTALGWAKIRPYSDREGYRHACEVSTYIDRGSCGQGIGDSLVPEQLKLARRMGYRHATA
ncbi:MAG: GNAT family N-acetyltransferase, partial [Planctomycetota bacterium]